MASFVNSDSLGSISGDNIFGCMDTGSYLLELTVTDSSGNSSFCALDVVVKDTMGVCDPPVVNGMLLAWGDVPIENASLLFYNSENIMDIVSTDKEGNFQYIRNDKDIEVISIDYGDDWMKYLTSNDLYLMEQFLTGAESPNQYELISADIDKNSQFNGNDFIGLKRLLMGEEIDEMYAYDSWAFFDPNELCDERDICMSNDNQIKMPALDNQTLQIHGVKTGDLDGDVLSDLESRNVVVMPYEINPVNEGLSESKQYKVTVLTDEVGSYNSMQIEFELPNSAKLEEVLGDRIYYNVVNENKVRIIALTSDDNIETNIEFIISTTDLNFEPEHVLMSQDFNSLLFSDNEKSQIVLNYYQPSFHSSFDNTEELSLCLFPNPSHTTSRMTINGLDNDELMMLEIHDNFGSLVRRSVINPKVIIDNNGLNLDNDISNGIYIISIQQGGRKTHVNYVKM